MKLYVVSSRDGTDLHRPECFDSEEKAMDYAKGIIYDAAFSVYDGDSESM